MRFQGRLIQESKLYIESDFWLERPFVLALGGSTLEGLEALDVTELSQAKVGISPCDILQSSSVSDDRAQWVQQCYCMLISSE